MPIHIPDGIHTKPWQTDGFVIRQTADFAPGKHLSRINPLVKINLYSGKEKNNY